MQTFLPYPDFSKSAKCLDRQRLGKQRVEILQVLTALTNSAYGWQNHPAVKMWRGYESALARYGLVVCNEWIGRGYKDTCYQKICALFDYVIPFAVEPSWLGNEGLHASHRACLLAKNYDHYSQFGWAEQPTGPNEDGKWPYVWPV